MKFVKLMRTNTIASVKVSNTVDMNSTAFKVFEYYRAIKISKLKN